MAAEIQADSGSPLNRLSWLRSSHTFLNAVAASPKARWLVANGGQQLVSVPASSSSDMPVIAQLRTEQIKSLLGPEPYFGQGKDEGRTLTLDEVTPFTESARQRGPRVVFLGLLDSLSSLNALPTSDFTDPERAVAKLEGIPYFAFDIGELGVDIDTFLNQDKDNQVLSWQEARTVLMGLQLDKVSLALFNQARSMVDWNQRNKFCPACGSTTYSMWGGWKISCSTLLPWADNTGRKPCVTGKGLHNFTHPRTDPVVIMIAIDETGDKILLGRGKKFPGKFYSALAGFIEPGETFEDAVVREMWEEAGVKAWDVTYHSAQPWPFPANLMVGFYARADAAQPIRLDLDNELMDARWYTRAEILEVLEHKLGTTFGAADRKRLAEAGNSAGHEKISAEVKPAEPVVDEPPFRVPPTSAIAGVLIREWAYKKIQFPPAGVAVQKGNL
ncbi:NUDIX hydrolase domain-like protein [Mycena albidolilacea]|uniref:NAD(+) diphosphatase n=1 Tax=Mycena albidolilacea TaxID=1033008 RepID=A0AAD7EUB1_9AGAR|nr:NUDIX hydrolase domain-like protein [Mycena albidolilacea]